MGYVTDIKLGKIVCKGAVIVLPPCADAIAKLAAYELSRYLYLLTGSKNPVVEKMPSDGTAIILETEAGAQADKPELKNDGFVIQSGKRQSLTFISISASQTRGLLYGTYALLEELGVGFYLGGETFPDGLIEAAFPAGVRRVQHPVFTVRGSLLHDNTLVGITTWGLSDFHAYFNRMAQLRCNTVILMSYNNDFEPLESGVDEAPRPIMSTITKPWGAVSALRTAEFAFGTGDFFDAEIYSSPAGQFIADPFAQRRETVTVISEAMRLGRLCGVDTAAGLIEPVGDVNNPVDPTSPAEAARFKMRVQRFLQHYPYITYFILTNHESGGCTGTRPPVDGMARRLFGERQQQFAYLGNSRRVWEAIRFLAFAEMAYKVIRETAPHVRLVLSGWGGDRWMRFADYYMGYDKIGRAHV